MRIITVYTHVHYGVGAVADGKMYNVRIAQKLKVFHTGSTTRFEPHAVYVRRS